MRFDFPSEARLRSPRQFDLIFRTGRRKTGELVRLLFLEKPNEPTRFGVAVSKKIANSVRRSRGRRMLRESVRRLRPWTKDGYWIVVSLRDSGLFVSATDIYFELAELMRDMKLLSEDWPGADWDADKKQ